MKEPRVCGFPDCGEPMRAQNLCSTHFAQWKTNKELHPIKQKKLLSEDRKWCVTEGCQNIARKNGLKCQGCTRRGVKTEGLLGSVEEILERKNKALLKQYCMTIKEYEELLWTQQDGRCALGREKAPSIIEMATTRKRHSFWPVDHDHRCCPGKLSCGRCVRGVLCYRCNIAVSEAWDNPEWRERALTYIDSRFS